MWSVRGHWKQMEKTVTWKCLNQFCQSPKNFGQIRPIVDECVGQYIYVHNLPSRFNDDLLEDCHSINQWYDICEYLSNSGLGPQLSNSGDVDDFPNKSWFATDQFLLEVIFRTRMKDYKCLTNDSAMASAVYVPFYAGLEISRHLWGFNASVRDAVSNDLIKFLENANNESFWGSNFLRLPESENMTILGIESSHGADNDFGIPYPTYFHPSHDSEVFEWQNSMRRKRRQYLFSFAGADRPQDGDSIRGEMMNQCRASRDKCKLLDCAFDKKNNCKTINVMQMFQNSSFCLQPTGDSFTRRSTFDSILAGCIPVFFHPVSAYRQYLWHLPKEHTKYSVFIPMNYIKEGIVSIEKVLLGIPEQRMLAMREEVISLIPKIIYANPSSKLETIEDAFDISIREVLQRVKEMRRVGRGERSTVG
ncbi:Xyloglucan galactosyltransferase MUR3 [Vitis vinifera]|uniref:Xyloglucan galactosyltransferase MUR3 n=1 Tax=Vitis vinifera TaxID=29760 RepID=A0A438CM33_VITVI|nr:Xyloglucan galactosyltransferase MUR3 [Vitis vinifera]